MRKALRGNGFEGNVSFPANLGVWKTRGNLIKRFLVDWIKSMGSVRAD
jgi:hypothetical protein